MKITPDSNLMYCNNLNTNSNRKTNYIDKSSNIKSFDEILINKCKEIPENKFVSELKNQIMNDIRKPHSQKELEELKLQIEEGSYQIGIDEIVRKIIL